MHRPDRSAPGRGPGTPGGRSRRHHTGARPIRHLRGTRDGCGRPPAVPSSPTPIDTGLRTSLAWAALPGQATGPGPVEEIRTMSDEHLLAERDGAVLRLTLNRPEQRNAISPAVSAGLLTHLRGCRGDATLRAIVISAVGDKAFCAGADLGTGKAFRFDYAEPRLPMPELFRAARACDVPIVARVNGTCMAGGMGLLAMCDLAIAADHAVFGLPEVKVGVYPMQVLAVLQHLVPRRALLALCLTGDPIDAHEARAIGLVNRVVPKDGLDAAVDALLATLAERSPTAIRRGRYAHYAIEALSFEESLMFMEGQIGLLAATEDAVEGQLAFREKRRPRWTGR
jgi:enoyl-CoA hydratase/carnithine racemase